jgi:hypothetical protein
MALIAVKVAPSFPALTRVVLASRDRGRIASHVRANTARYSSEGSLMPRVIVTTANGVGEPCVGGPILMDEQVDLIQMDRAHHVPEFLERMAMALEGAEQAEARFALLGKRAESSESYPKIRARP